MAATTTITTTIKTNIPNKSPTFLLLQNIRSCPNNSPGRPGDRVRGKKDGAVEKCREGQAALGVQQSKKAVKELSRRDPEEWEKCLIYL